ncbi:hypothetical protein GQ44DRAFT_778958 [Phaeosphaeriaceae sp. PMI808]|nr:hypothetical protein GQ44DRAFT_778958 [Phaeosphaeriaceae sp. PMI808]
MAEYRFDDLVTKMAGRDTLNGWDVLISYRDSLVLEEIKKQNSFSTLLDPLTWTDQLTDMFGNCSSIQMSLQLQPPSISLANGEAKINLTFPIQECSWRIVDSTPSSPQTQQLPPGLSVVLSTPLGAISGDFAIGVRGNKFSVDLGATSFVNANTVQILEHHEPTQYWAFCLDFDHVFADIAPSQQILQPINRIICRKVAELFEARNVRFYMGSLSQIMTEEPSIMNGMFLHPNRFCFTVSGSALCIWIEVSGMENSSLEPSTRRKLEFKPDGSVINPIPVGSDASIVFSHALMHTFLKASSLTLITVTTLIPPYSGELDFQASA